jgi:hypothetical protein
MRAQTRARRQQGSAYVQALVVALMMMVVFACAIMFGHAYDAKIVTGQTARAAAWTQGGKGCGGKKTKVADDARPIASEADKPQTGDVVSRAASASLRSPRAPSSPDSATH